MPNIRLILWGVLAALLFLNYQTWVHDYETASPAAQSAATQSSRLARQCTGRVGTPGDDTARTQRSRPDKRHGVWCGTGHLAHGHCARNRTIGNGDSRRSGARGRRPSAPIRVTTDVLDIEINLKGGELDRADLLQYPQRKDTPNIPVRLLSYRTATDAVSAAKRAHRPSG